MLQAAGGDHAAAAMGARGRRLHRAPVRREAPADARRAQRRRARHAGVHPAPVRPRAAQRRRAARRRLHAGHARRRRAARSTRDAAGNPTGLLLAKPNAAILYATLAKGPKLPFDYQLNSTRHFMRELNRLGVTGAIDAGGGFQNYPEDYAGHPAAGRRRPAHRPPRLQPVHAEAEGRRRRTSCSWTASSTLQAGRRLLPPQRRRRDAGVLGRRLRGLPPAAARHAAARWRASSRRWCASWRRTAGRGACTPPTTRPSRRALDVFEKVNHDMPLDGPALVLRPRRDDLRRNRSTASPRSAAASPCSTAWPTRANTSSSATAPAAAEATPPVARMLDEGRARLGRHRRHARRVLQPLGVARPGWSPAGRSAACSSTRSATASTARRRCACGPRTSPGSPTRKARRAASRWASSPT